jgi:hypothetical protein
VDHASVSGLRGPVDAIDLDPTHGDGHSRVESIRCPSFTLLATRGSQAHLGWVVREARRPARRFLLDGEFPCLRVLRVPSWPQRLRSHDFKPPQGRGYMNEGERMGPIFSGKGGCKRGHSGSNHGGWPSGTGKPSGGGRCKGERR